MRILITTIAYLSLINLVFGQDLDISKNCITFSIGHGFEDALSRYSYIPTMGLGYERKINKYFGAYGRLSTFYRRTPITQFLDGDRPSVGRITKNSNSPFLTQEDYEATRNLGIKDLPSSYSYKALSVPLSIGLKFTALRFKRHSLNIYGAIVGMYENKNFFIEHLSGPVQTINSDDVSEEYILTLISETNWRNFTLGENIGLSYEVAFNNFAVEIYASEKNIILAANNASIIYDVSLRVKLKI